MSNVFSQHQPCLEPSWSFDSKADSTIGMAGFRPGVALSLQRHNWRLNVRGSVGSVVVPLVSFAPYREFASRSEQVFQKNTKSGYLKAWSLVVYEEVAIC